MHRTKTGNLKLPQYQNAQARHFDHQLKKATYNKERIRQFLENLTSRPDNLEVAAAELRKTYNRHGAGPEFYLRLALVLMFAAKQSGLIDGIMSGESGQKRAMILKSQEETPYDPYSSLKTPLYPKAQVGEELVAIVTKNEGSEAGAEMKKHINDTREKLEKDIFFAGDLEDIVSSNESRIEKQNDAANSTDFAPLNFNAFGNEPVSGGFFNAARTLATTVDSGLSMLFNPLPTVAAGTIPYETKKIRPENNAEEFYRDNQKGIREIEIPTKSKIGDSESAGNNENPTQPDEEQKASESNQEVALANDSSHNTNVAESTKTSKDSLEFKPAALDNPDYDYREDKDTEQQGEVVDVGNQAGPAAVVGGVAAVISTVAQFVDIGLTVYYGQKTLEYQRQSLAEQRAQLHFLESIVEHLVTSGDENRQNFHQLQGTLDKMDKKIDELNKKLDRIGGKLDKKERGERIQRAQDAILKHQQKIQREDENRPIVNSTVESTIATVFSKPYFNLDPKERTITYGKDGMASLLDYIELMCKYDFASNVWKGIMDLQPFHPEARGNKKQDHSTFNEMVNNAAESIVMPMPQKIFLNLPSSKTFDSNGVASVTAPQKIKGHIVIEPYVQTGELSEEQSYGFIYRVGDASYNPWTAYGVDGSGSYGQELGITHTGTIYQRPSKVVSITTYVPDAKPNAHGVYQSIMYPVTLQVEESGFKEIVDFTIMKMVDEEIEDYLSQLDYYKDSIDKRDFDRRKSEVRTLIEECRNLTSSGKLLEALILIKQVHEGLRYEKSNPSAFSVAAQEFKRQEVGADADQLFQNPFKFTFQGAPHTVDNSLFNKLIEYGVSNDGFEPNLLEGNSKLSIFDLYLKTVYLKSLKDKPKLLNELNKALKIYKERKEAKEKLVQENADANAREAIKLKIEALFGDISKDAYDYSHTRVGELGDFIHKEVSKATHVPPYTTDDYDVEEFDGNVGEALSQISQLLRTYGQMEVFINKGPVLNRTVTPMSGQDWDGVPSQQRVTPGALTDEDGYEYEEDSENEMEDNNPQESNDPKVVHNKFSFKGSKVFKSPLSGMKFNPFGTTKTNTILTQVPKNPKGISVNKKYIKSKTDSNRNAIASYRQAEDKKRIESRGNVDKKVKNEQDSKDKFISGPAGAPGGGGYMERVVITDKKGDKHKQPFYKKIDKYGKPEPGFFDKKGRKVGHTIKEAAEVMQGRMLGKFSDIIKNAGLRMWHIAATAGGIAITSAGAMCVMCRKCGKAVCCCKSSGMGGGGGGGGGGGQELAVRTTTADKPCTSSYAANSDRLENTAHNAQQSGINHYRDVPQNNKEQGETVSFISDVSNGKSPFVPFSNTTELDIPKGRQFEFSSHGGKPSRFRYNGKDDDPEYRIVIAERDGKQGVMCSVSSKGVNYVNVKRNEPGTMGMVVNQNAITTSRI